MLSVFFFYTGFQCILCFIYIENTVQIWYKSTDKLNPTTKHSSIRILYACRIISNSVCGESYRITIHWYTPLAMRPRLYFGISIWKLKDMESGLLIEAAKYDLIETMQLETVFSLKSVPKIKRKTLTSIICFLGKILWNFSHSDESF